MEKYHGVLLDEQKSTGWKTRCCREGGTQAADEARETGHRRKKIKTISNSFTRIEWF